MYIWEKRYNTEMLYRYPKSKKYPNEIPTNAFFRHCFEMRSDTGLKIWMPQKFFYLPLDIFRRKHHSEGEVIHKKFEAWLTLSCAA